MMILALGLSAGGAQAQQVAPCDWQASAENIVEPWADNSRTFAEGAVRLALLDTVEPAAAAFWLLVLSPPHDELGIRQCRLVGADGMGFGGADFLKLTAGYDPRVGLTFTLPVTLFDPQTSGFTARILSVDVNQQTGRIDARLK